MMTQPIQMFENLTSETTPAGGNASTKTHFSQHDRRLIELQARYARSALLADLLTDALLWVRSQYRHVVAAVKADLKLRAAESQLLAMTDRELADLGLSRADIPFVLRETADGVLPTIDAATAYSAPANQNMRHAA